MESCFTKLKCSLKIKCVLTNNMSELEILQEFKNHLIDFFDELINQFPEESDLIFIRIFLKDQIPIQDVMNNFIFQMNTENGKMREMVRERNEAFFIEHDIFSGFGKSKVKHFEHLWRTQFDDADKKIMWKWIDSFIIKSDKYIKATKKKTIDQK